MNEPPRDTPDAGPAPNPTPSDSIPAVAAKPPPALTPDEQMALFAQELKENDWGHQPC